MNIGKNWFCVRSQPKRERIAYSQLCTLPDVTVLLPQICYPKANRVRKRHVTEPIFPGYLFVEFDPAESLRAVNYTQGLAYIVRQGKELATIPQYFIDELQAIMPKDSDVLSLAEADICLDDSINFISGIFMADEGKVKSMAPAEKRIEVLLEVLEQDSMMNMPEGALKNEIDTPLELVK